MGCLSTKPEITNGAKYNKNHRKRKMFSLGIGIERGDITMSAHTQIGYVSAMVKKYDKQNDESTTETDVDVPDKLPIDPDNGCGSSCHRHPKITISILMLSGTLKFFLLLKILPSYCLKYFLTPIVGNLTFRILK